MLNKKLLKAGAVKRPAPCCRTRSPLHDGASSFRLLVVAFALLLSAVPRVSAQEKTITFVGIWDRARPLIERAARSTQTQVRFFPGEIEDKALSPLLGESGLVLVLNVRSKTAMHMLAVLKDKKSDRLRLLQLDERDGHASLLKAGFMTRDPKIRAYWRANGLVNMKRLLVYLSATYLGVPGDVQPPTAVPDQGFYRPGHDQAIPSIEELRKLSPWKEDSPRAALLIQQSFWITQDVKVIDDLVFALENQGFNVAVVFSESQTWFRKTLTAFRPDIIVEDRHGSLWEDTQGNLLSDLDAPYLRPISMLAYTVDEWLADPQGLAVRDRTMFMALQELHGTIEPMVVGGLAHSIRGFRLHEPIAGRVDRFAKRARSWANLRKKAPADRKIALIYYNKSLGKSDVMRGSPTGAFLDMPTSLVAFLKRMKKEGYNVGTPPQNAEDLLQIAMERGRNLGPWAQGELEETVDRGDVVLVSASRFKRWLEDKLDLAQRAALEEHFGPAPGKLMVVKRNGEPQIMLPLMRFGNVIIGPQPERGSKQDRALLHSRKVPPPYNYLAFYWWLEEEFAADAIGHFGTHGSLELLPGKEAGLTGRDWGDICVGTMPVVNLWIMDNLGEASLSRRRSYALLSDHLPPPAVESGLHDELRALHEDIHKFNSLEEGMLRQAFRRRITAGAKKQGLEVALGIVLDDEKLLTDKEVERVGDQLHDIEETTTPTTLHVLGQPTPKKLMAEYLVSCLRRSFVTAVQSLSANKTTPIEDPAHAYENAHDVAIRLVERCVLGDEEAPFSLRPFVSKGKMIHEKLLLADEEMKGLLSGLDGRFVEPGPGPDPIRNPNSVPGGRNLYGLNPEEIPTRPSWEVAQILVKQLLASKNPTKVGLDLNGMNTMRDFGVMEGQVLYLLGVQPVWNESELVIDVKLIPRDVLGRPRVDVFVALGGTYKENFPSRVKLLDKAVLLASQSKEADNGVRAGTQRQESALLERGFAEERARDLAHARIFGSKPGDISGTKILDLVPRSGVWESDDEITSVYLDSMGFVYSGKHQGEKIDGLYETAIQGTDTILRVWASNMTSQLSNHHAYEYLGGLSMAVTNMCGKEPEAFIADVRDPEGARMRRFEEVLATNLHSELLNRRWIEGMKEHGYAGAGMMAELVKNTFGWDVTRSSAVPESLWGEIESIYVDDRYKLGLKDWFEKSNPHALQEITATMLEAIRKDYWHADDATRRRLSELYAKSVAKHGVSAGLITGGNRKLSEEVKKDLSALGEEALRAAFEKAMEKSNGEKDSAKPEGKNAVYGPALEETVENENRTENSGSSSNRFVMALGVLLLGVLILGYRRKMGGIS